MTWVALLPISLWFLKQNFIRRCINNRVTLKTTNACVLQLSEEFQLEFITHEGATARLSLLRHSLLISR